jgi:hypothetical protein
MFLLDTNFERISRVTVEVKPATRELEYWQPIEAMAEEHRAGRRLEGQDLPPPAFAATLRTLLDHREVREGIRAILRAEGIDPSTDPAAWDAISRAEALRLGPDEKFAATPVKHRRVAILITESASSGTPGRSERHPRHRRGGDPAGGW